MLGRIACTECQHAGMRPTVTNVLWSLSLCLLDIGLTMSCAETAEPMLMPFGAWTREPCSRPQEEGEWEGAILGAPLRALFRQHFLTAC